MRVLIADDHPLLVDGLRSLLEAHDIEVAGIAGDGRAAVEMALGLDPDLVLMDIRMPVCDGLAATRLIKAQRPEMKIVMLTTSAEDSDLFEAIKSGACGYLLKVMSVPAFVEALHGLEQGVPPFSPGLAERLLREFARLTRRVFDIVRKEEACRRLMSAPGVGPITALAFRATIDRPERFGSSRAVGAHLGLTPARYQSGETDIQGRISRCGDELARTALYEAAHSLLVRSKKWSNLRAWGMNIARRRGMARARVAVARKLAVILHRMWADATEFRFGKEPAALAA